MSRHLHLHPGDAPHGTRVRYVVQKCRCALCRAANTQYYRDRQKQIAEHRAAVRPSGPPGQGTLVRAGHTYRVKTCPGANGAPCLRTPAAWLRGKGDVCGRCIERVILGAGTVSVEQAQAHLLQLRQEGVGRRSVRDASDVASSTLARVIAGEGKIRAQTLQRILATDAGAKADHALASKKDVRRMKGRLTRLVSKGFRKGHLAVLLGANRKALYLGSTGGALVVTVAAVDKLWRRVLRGEVCPEPGLVDAVPVYAKLRALGLPQHQLAKRLGFHVLLTSPPAKVRRSNAAKVDAFAGELAAAEAARVKAVQDAEKARQRVLQEAEQRRAKEERDLELCHIALSRQAS